MLEQLDYLIRTLTYKRSCLECDVKNVDKCCCDEDEEYMRGQINGLSIAITELYKMVMELTKDDE